MIGPESFRGSFRNDPRACGAYAEGAGIYRIVPSAVALPADVADLAAMVRWARERRLSLIPRGAGSGMGGGNVGEGIIVDLTRLHPQVLEIHPERRMARTSAGVTLNQLNDAAAEHGLRLPPDPSSAAWATLGGMVATNAAGARTVRYGSVRRWVQEIEIVTADGEVGSLGRRTQAVQPDARKLRALDRFYRAVDPVIVAASDLIRSRFPKTRKNSSGYALDAYLESGEVVDLLIGSEGTLAIITEITWKLDPIPPARASLRIALDSLDDLGPAVQALQPLGPSALELLDRSFLDLVSSSRRTVEMPSIPAGTQVVLLVEFEGVDAAAVHGTVGDAVRCVKPWATDVETALMPEEEERLWALRHTASPILAGLPEDRRSMQVIEDGCVPIPRLGEYIGFLRRVAEQRDLTMVIFGHAGDGNVHVNLVPHLARVGWQAEVAGTFEEVNQEVVRLGGTVTGEHGDGRLRPGFLERRYGAEVMDLFHRVKTAFDEDGILNPGIVLPSEPPMPPVTRLKTGIGSAAIPADIAQELRAIERSGGYARNRLEIADGRS